MNKRKQSVFESRLHQGFKQKRIQNLSPVQKQEYRERKIEEIFEEITNKEDRYIFYCPDILIVNNLVRMIYDMAFYLKKSGYNILILHEIKGFKCKWILNEKRYEEYKIIPIDYIIQKKSSKSKKDKNSYSFKPSDTLIIPDVFQEILDNILELKLVQKVVLVSSYLGLGALRPGVNYKQLGVSSFIFLERRLMEDYVEMFKEEDNQFLLMDEYPIDKELFNENKNEINEVWPVIAMSNIGNQKLASQVTSIFYNLYPRLSLFSFKIVDRTNYEEYVDSLKHSCIFLILDDTIGFKQIIMESLEMGVPCVTYERRELNLLSGMKEEVEVLQKDPFEIAKVIASYCTLWLEESNNKLKNEAIEIKNKMGNSIDVETFRGRLINCVEELKKEKIKKFASIQQHFESEKDEIKNTSNS